MPLRTFAVLLALACAAIATATASARRPAAEPGRYIVVYRDAVEDPRGKTERLERGNGFRASHRYSRALKGFAAKLSRGHLAKVQADPDVEYVSPDRPVRASAAVVSGEYVPTGVRRMGAATSTAVRDASVARVAVIDSGIDLDHPDLNAANGANCIGAGPAEDDDGHGTHVAGTIGARNDGRGVTGVAPGTAVHAVKVLDATGSGEWSQVICGIEWVTSTRTDADPANDIAVANMSLGGAGDPVAPCATTTDPLHAAICASTAAGVTYVVAAGNDGWDFDYAPVPDVPAAYPEVLTVAALSDSDAKGGGTGAAPSCTTGETDDAPASFSNFALTAAGKEHTIAAPGVCIRSAGMGGGTATMSGTSMASPHAAGAVALCMGERGGGAPCAGLAPAQVVQRMRADAQARTTAVPSHGFQGDPTRPLDGGYYFGHALWAPDTVRPTASSVSPASGATGVSTAASVKVTFSEAMDQASAQGAFSLRRASDGAAVPGTFAWSANAMTFKPSAPLAEGETYAASVGTGARDAAGNAMAAERSWSFRAAVTTLTAPATVTGETGTTVSGDAGSLLADDNVFLATQSSTAATYTASWHASFGGVSNAVSSLKVRVRSKSSPSCTQSISFWSWSTSTWKRMETRTVGTTEVGVDRAASGTLSDYVSGSAGDGEVRVRIACTSTSAQFRHSADQLRLTDVGP